MDKGPGHTGRLILARSAETDQPIYPVAIGGKGSILRRPIASDESQGFFPDGKRLSVAMHVKFPTVETSGDVFMTTSILSKTTGGALRLIPRPSTASSITAPAASDMDTWHWVLTSIDTGMGTACAVTVSQADGVQTGSVVGTIADLNMSLSSIDGLLTKNGGDASPLTAHFKQLWAADDYIDWTDQAQRDLRFDSTTLEPVTMVADGVVNSISPKIYVRGRVGDYLTGKNFAPGGSQMVAPFPINQYESVFEDLVE